jgi:hypothetical protein
MIFSFNVNEASEVRIWGTDADDKTQLFFFQPFHPSGNAWESKESAENWAEQKLAQLQELEPEAPAEEQPAP